MNMWFDIIKVSLTPLGQQQLQSLKRNAQSAKPHYTEALNMPDLGEMIDTLQFYADNRQVDRMWLMGLLDYLQQLKYNGEISMARPLTPIKELEEVAGDLQSIWSRHLEGST